MQITEKEARALADIPKYGEPLMEWRQERPNSISNIFGVTNDIDQGIKGLYIEFCVIGSPRLALPKYVLTLMKQELTCHNRAYQLEINCRPSASGHDNSHEHYGTYPEGRYNATGDWPKSNLEEAIQLFCKKCNLTLTESVPDYRAFTLK
jgi:hypothetical protein